MWIQEENSSGLQSPQKQIYFYPEICVIVVTDQPDLVQPEKTQSFRCNFRFPVRVNDVKVLVFVALRVCSHLVIIKIAQVVHI